MDLLSYNKLLRSVDHLPDQHLEGIAWAFFRQYVENKAKDHNELIALVFDKIKKENVEQFLTVFQQNFRKILQEDDGVRFKRGLDILRFDERKFHYYSYTSFQHVINNYGNPIPHMLGVVMDYSSFFSGGALKVLLDQAWKRAQFDNSLMAGNIPLRERLLDYYPQLPLEQFKMELMEPKGQPGAFFKKYKDEAARIGFELLVDKKNWEALDKHIETFLEIEPDLIFHLRETKLPQNLANYPKLQAFSTKIALRDTLKVEHKPQNPKKM